MDLAKWGHPAPWAGGQPQGGAGREEGEEAVGQGEEEGREEGGGAQREGAEQGRIPAGRGIPTWLPVGLCQNLKEVVILGGSMIGSLEAGN